VNHRSATTEVAEPWFILAAAPPGALMCGLTTAVVAEPWFSF
jgi:hypothetical protein